MMTTTTATGRVVVSEAQAYFCGYSDGEARVAVLGDEARLLAVVEGHRRAVARGRVAREALSAYARGWRAAEAMSVRS